MKEMHPAFKRTMIALSTMDGVKFRFFALPSNEPCFLSEKRDAKGFVHYINAWQQELYRKEDDGSFTMIEMLTRIEFRGRDLKLLANQIYTAVKKSGLYYLVLRDLSVSNATITVDVSEIGGRLYK